LHKEIQLFESTDTRCVWSNTPIPPRSCSVPWAAKACSAALTP